MPYHQHPLEGACKIIAIDPHLVKAFGDVLRRHGVEVTKDTIEKIRETLGYVPRVGVLGKTGVGKSALFNALFGHDVAEVNDVSACTRAPQQALLDMQGDLAGVLLVDLPGLGESAERDVEYAALYRSLLPELDLVLWVVKADDRALAADKAYYQTIVEPEIGRSATKFLVVVNQCDKLEPTDDWIRDERRPGAEQLANIERKRSDVGALFNLPTAEICGASATRRWQLTELVDRMVLALPEHARYGFVRGTREEHVSESARQHGAKGAVTTLLKEIGLAVGMAAFAALVAAIAARSAKRDGT
ncbi:MULTISPECIES: GTPase [Burkholderia cepacia complex]|uniref:GTPase n=1 Tax=Burkholderia cepacia complex TaxID=87882 RepID=UPI001CF2263F|nr:MULTISPECIES: GTPase [Burkholderia cepacia complex]MCA8081384.1 50S ribosome-binding GTPase [Burkholderia cepacia]